jgi:hypothetical protein
MNYQMEQQSNNNNRLYEFIRAEAERLFKKIYEEDNASELDAVKIASILTNKNIDFKQQYEKIKTIQTQCINDFPQALPLWTDMFIQIIELVEFAETYYKNLDYLKDPDLSFEKTYDYFFKSGLRPKRTSSKI